MEYHSLKAIETTDFQKDVDSIDQFLYGRINQDTWQSSPIELNGKEYIKYKPILDKWLDKREVLEIQIHIPDEV